MDTFDITFAKEHLEELLDRAARGEDVCIDVPGQGTFALTPRPAEEPRRKRVAGRWKGRLTEPARLMEPLTEEELALLSGETSP